jgi:hypothetical protein
MPKANHAHITSRRRALVALSTGLAAVNSWRAAPPSVPSTLDLLPSLALRPPSNRAAPHRVRLRGTHPKKEAPQGSRPARLFR